MLLKIKKLPTIIGILCQIPNHPLGNAVSLRHCSCLLMTKQDASKEAIKEGKPEFYFENGLRKVYPYYYTFTTYTKQRWLGKLLADILLQEYRGSTKEGLARDFELGRIKIHGVPVSTDHVLDHNEFIERTMHRHELPVIDSPIDIIYEDADLLVVNKPASIPIHPCGRFNRNSLAYLLENEKKLQGLHIVHRLDRMTSGVLIIGKTPSRASQISAQVRDRLVQKWYLARVEGEFPDTGEVICDKPLAPLSKKLGLQMATTEEAGGKPSRSVFRRLAFNGRTSLVECQPLTGRTHQLRVHLQYLGFPIANDPLYNCSVWGPEKGKGGRFGKPTEQLVCDISAWHSEEHFLLSYRDQDVSNSEPLAKRAKYQCSGSGIGGGPGLDPSLLEADPDCPDCKLNADIGGYRDPVYNELVLFLHASRYKGPGFDFCAPLPDWADDGFDCSNYV